MSVLSRDDFRVLRHIKETGRIGQLAIPTFLKLIGLGLVVISAGRTWRLTARGNETLAAEEKD